MNANTANVNVALVSADGTQAGTSVHKYRAMNQSLGAAILVDSGRQLNAVAPTSCSLVAFVGVGVRGGTAASGGWFPLLWGRSGWTTR